MNKCIWISLLLIVVGPTLHGQISNFVFPGDANANGRVDHYDILPIGYGFGSFGPSRISIEDASTVPQPQGIPQEWSQHFNDTLNYIHADANGDGLVSFLDFLVVDQNFGQGLEQVEPLLFSSTENLMEAALVLNNNDQLPPFVEGTIVEIPIRLREAEIGQTSLNGIAFSIDFEETHFARVDFQFNENWLLSGGQGIPFIKKEEGRLDIALSRFGVNPITGGGDVGILRLVIIEDLVSLLETPADTLLSDVTIKNIQAFDGDYQLVPVVCPEMLLRMYCEGKNTNTKSPWRDDLQAKLFPNPVAGPFQVTTAEHFTTVNLITLAGQKSLLYEGTAINRWQYADLDLPAGIYLLEIQGETGKSILKFQKQ